MIDHIRFDCGSLQTEWSRRQQKGIIRFKRAFGVVVWLESDSDRGSATGRLRSAAVAALAGLSGGMTISIALLFVFGPSLAPMNWIDTGRSDAFKLRRMGFAMPFSGTLVGFSRAR